MSVTEPGLQRLRMSWEEYLALPGKPKAEWVDGEVVVSPPVGMPHGRAAVLDRDHLVAEVAVGEHGIVRLDLREILPRAAGPQQ